MSRPEEPTESQSPEATTAETEADANAGEDGTPKPPPERQAAAEAEEASQAAPEAEPDDESDEEQAGGEVVDFGQAPSAEPAPPSVEDRLLAQLADTRARLQDTEARLRAVSRAYTDLQKEQAAFRERTAALEQVKADRKRAELVEAFFEPVENLKRSLESITEDNPLAAGLLMVLAQFTDTLARLGLEQVPGVGAVFDPSVHEALAVMPTDQPGLDGRIIAVHNTGYRVGTRTLQAAQVIIGKYEAPPAPVEAVAVEAEEPAGDASESPGESPADEPPADEPEER